MVLHFSLERYHQRRYSQPDTGFVPGDLVCRVTNGDRDLSVLVRRGWSRRCSGFVVEFGAAAEKSISAEGSIAAKKVEQPLLVGCHVYASATVVQTSEPSMLTPTQEIVTNEKRHAYAIDGVG